MQGKRVYPIIKSDGKEWLPVPESGDYCKIDGECMVVAPTSKAWGSISEHKVEEHEDGTITVSPSILRTWGDGGDNSYHGYLKRGEWTESL